MSNSQVYDNIGSESYETETIVISEKGAFPMALKIVESFDGSFTLAVNEKAELFALLTNPAFLEQLKEQVKADMVEFTELLFQPVPYCTATPKGMPTEFEPYHNSPDYIIINVPPNFMFKAKIFKPSRLCAIYRILPNSSDN
ncbi:MAG: hypothetical protein RLZZ338_3409 [Cyanobacteriota bacterium]